MENQHETMKVILPETVGVGLRFCCTGRIPRLSLNEHSLYVGVVEKPPPPPPLTWEQYGKMELKYPEGGHCQSILLPRGGGLTSPFILNNSVETAVPFNVISHPRCSEPRNESLEKVSTSYGVRTCDRWHQVPGA